MTTAEYNKQATDFLESHGIQFSVVLIGSACPVFCDDARENRDMDKVNVFPRRTHIHGKQYRVTFTRYPFTPQQLSELPEVIKTALAEGKRNYSVGDYANSRAVRESGSFTVDFWNSYADEQHNHNLGLFIGGKRITGKRMQPTAYDVLTSITKSDPGTFEDFCGEYGYDSDSRRAYQTYEAVVSEWKQVKRFFSDAEIQELQEIN